MTVTYVLHNPEAEGAIEQSLLYQKGFFDGRFDAQFGQWTNFLERLLPEEKTMPYWQGYAAGRAAYQESLRHAS